MRRAKLGVLIICSLVCASWQPPRWERQGSRARLAAYRDNNCVTCHARVLEPVRVSAHFYEWLNSAHAQKGVGCERCHGGDPAATGPQAAHKGVLRAAFPQSSLHPQRLAVTCGACHEQVVRAFTNSKHYQKLRESGAGPSCTTCHQHMATAVITWPPQTTALCAKCHNQAGGPAAQYLDVLERAGDVIAAFSRADEVTDWAQFLIAEQRQRGRSLDAEAEQLRRLAAILQDAKLSWHKFNLPRSRQQADQVFFAAGKIKDGLGRKTR